MILRPLSIYTLSYQDLPKKGQYQHIFLEGGFIYIYKDSPPFCDPLPPVVLVCALVCVCALLGCALLVNVGKFALEVKRLTI
jgi:hypothetical protein